MRFLLRILCVLILGFTWSSPVLATPQLLVDMRSGEVLYEEDAGVTWHPASLTKLMTAYVAFEAISSGNASLNTPVIMSENALKAPPSKMGFPVGTAVTLEDALYLLVVKSANDVAIAVAETIGGSEQKFINLMNAHARNLGMSNSFFVNPNGLHEPDQVTSARDLAILSIVIRNRYPQYDGIFNTRTVEFGKSKLASFNILLTKFRGTTGMKTGYVCSSGLNIVATAERNGRKLMAVVLGGSSSRERGELTALLLERGFSNRYPGTGKSVTRIANLAVPPVDMRPKICGKQANEYVAARKAAFPFGLEGEITYLGDSVAAKRVRVRTLGKLVNVDLPRPRPSYIFVPSVAQIALPKPRPSN
ncbi:D-alanyl-D-alanine carboxypeptidase family protein [Maritalea sp.]|uniref:D-alanyl-D-alanine carboxypeptidase family protein n=1 Tax=Maritalea sp. TaxID=2003361 RepID=UPI003EF52B2C